MLETRPAHEADVDFLCHLHQLAYREVVTRQFGVWDDAAQAERYRQRLVVARYRIVEQDGHAVGAVCTSDEEDHLSIIELQILPEWQNRGIGSAILEKQIQRAASLKKAQVRLQVLRENRARRLYERRGFAVTSESETHYIMVLRL
jgi:ribosomal protein S18 acetylase RimI-like enzyme